ncbi:hypothetical protein JHK86_047869 [Glycine max]|nr:hypothetical protein JHK86_047869 [Glycine max]
MLPRYRLTIHGLFHPDLTIQGHLTYLRKMMISDLFTVRSSLNLSTMLAAQFRAFSPTMFLKAIHLIFCDDGVKAPGGTDASTHFRDSLLYNHLTSA